MTLSHLYLAARTGGKHHWSVLGGTAIVIGGGLLAGAAKALPTAPQRRRHGPNYTKLGCGLVVTALALFVAGLLAG